MNNVVTLTGEVKVLKKSSKILTIYLKPKNRVLVTKDNIVSSLSQLDIFNIYEQLKKSSMCVFSLENGSKQKVAIIDNVNVVKINNKDILKLKLSSYKYNVVGFFAKKAVNLQDSVAADAVFSFSFLFSRTRGGYEGVVIRDRNFTTDRNLEGAIFRGSVITNSNFTNANLTNAIFRGSDLRGSNFTNANLTNADFRGSDLRGSNFTRANLTNADFRGSNFYNAILTDAITTGARFYSNIDDNDNYIDEF
jgi:uncharacterized protein YjbI with pentapeptide repeats